VPLAIKGTLVPKPSSPHKLGGHTRVGSDAGIAGGRGKTAAQVPQLPSLLLATQNVRGFSKKKKRTQAWFDRLRGQIEGTSMDAIMLQETKATQSWAELLEQRYAQGWGIRLEQATAPLSFWTSTKRASGGVAILLHPDSPLCQLRPRWSDLWGPHCLALDGTVNGLALTLVCVYAPVDRNAREALYSALSRKQPRGAIFLGGDFNCTVHATLDRSHASGDTHDSPMLQRLLRRWSIVDSATSTCCKRSTQERKRTSTADRTRIGTASQTGGKRAAG
jgi:hypothetical protein